MNKKEKTTTKIISKLILFLFVISLFGFILPAQTSAENSMSSFYANPNQSSFSGSYKFKISDVVNSNLLTSVVGCTGVVNKVSTWMIGFIQSPLQQTKIAAAQTEKAITQLKNTCAVIKAAAKTAAGSVPGPNNLPAGIDTTLGKIKWCEENVDAKNDKQLAATVEQIDKENEVALKEQCFDGIAITLAKNQLTAMTRSAMNWVNTGWGGNPFFVQNMTNLTNNIERNVLETGIDILLAPEGDEGNQNPYAKSFAESTVRTNRGLVSSSASFLGNLTADLNAFISDPQSYYTNDQLNSAEDTRTALERAQEANDAFSNDFSIGGWDAWMALTQRDQNNPLGFTMLANQYLADVQSQQVADTKDELAQNNGFLSQKTCATWNDAEKEALQEKLDTLTAKERACTNNDDGACDIISLDIDSTSAKITSFVRECTKYKTITPGSIIRDKTTNYLNSPERQLELAKTINDSLNALFSILISKLEEGGLSGLSDSATNTTNWTDSTNIFEKTDSDGNTTYDNGGAYNDFNLTRDLGNTYIYDNIIKLGTWDATTNTATLTNSNYTPKDEANKKIKLYPNTAPEVYKIATDGEVKLINSQYGSIVNPINGYYTVSTSGKTKIVTAGSNAWEKGDRAFWNGSEWQNWKCKEVDGKCTSQLNPIKKRGVIQIQNDYIVAGKEILGELDKIMPKLGELDYCLPGPNPNYKINSSNAQSAYQDWVGSIYVGIYDNSGKRYGVKMDGEGDRTYDSLKSIYSPSVWGAIRTDVSSTGIPDIGCSETDRLAGKCSMPGFVSGLMNEFNYICNAKGKNCNKDGYLYTGGTPNDDEQAQLDSKTTLMEEVLNYVNNDLFQNFYKLFDSEINDRYFKMTNPYLDTETSIGEKTNPNYIPMAEAGFNLTKDIVYYDDDTTKAKKAYADAISVARVNISKLEPIKNEVSGIIKAAQDRRSEKLVETLGLSFSEIQTKYKTCFDEENIQFYDADKITPMSSSHNENCADGIDNDLDGLIDSLDHKDCDGVVTAAPSTPTDLSVSPSYCGNNWLNISWNPATGPAVKKYRVYRDGGATPVFEKNALYFSDTDLELGSTHSYKVSAINDIGESTLSTSKSGTVSNKCLYTLTYKASFGGEIVGKTSQTDIISGGSGTEVTAVPGVFNGATYTFTSWSDGLATPSRTDKNVTASKTYTAYFKKGVTIDPDKLQ